MEEIDGSPWIGMVMGREKGFGGMTMENLHHGP